MTRISVVVLSYNTREVTKKCLLLLIESLKKIAAETQIIVVDNGSHDGSVGMLRKIQRSNLPPSPRLRRASKIQNYKLKIKVIFNKKNLGFSKANNQAIKKVTSKHVLFLNSDVMIDNVNLKKILQYFDNDGNVGAMGVKVILPNGKIDPASHRGFPTVWNSFCYYFKLEMLLGSLGILGRMFGGYHLSYLDLSKVHEIDSPSGAFFLTSKDILNKVGGFDETFFMYGEDLDLAFRIKKTGYRIIYYPLYQVTHLKYVSGLAKNDGETRGQTKKYFYDAMKIFYRKHYEKTHPSIVNRLIYLFIDLKQLLT